LAFILGILERSEPACVAFEDFRGPHGAALESWQRQGFLATEPEPHRVPSCPHCGEGSLFELDVGLLCGSCLSEIDPRHRFLWRFDEAALRQWLGRSLGLDGGVRTVDGRLWHLGSREDRDGACEFFFLRGVLSEQGRTRLLAYRNAVLVRPLPMSESVTGFTGRVLSLLDLLRIEGDALIVSSLQRFLEHEGGVRFDADGGQLIAGDAVVGEVPVASKEYHLLACLAENLDRYVPYADLKHEILRRSGSRDTTDDATFCQKLKSRIKRQVPKIDRLITTTNKGDGYRLRGWVER
jgi:hypothetical protein